MRTSYRLMAAGLAAVAACSDQPPVSGPAEPAPAPLLAVGGPTQSDRYIVVFKPGVTDPDAETDNLIRTHGGQVSYRYGAAIKGFAATLPATALEGIRRSPSVQYVEADGVMFAIGTQSNPPSWGQDRIDQRDLPLDKSYGYENSGEGVNAYIIDTGVRFDHPEYVGRATSGYDFIDNDADASDCHGHGTHVSGTVAGTNVGVAKLAHIVGVRVLSCAGSGSWAQVIAGINWVAANHSGPSVANMSLGGGYSQSVNDAVTGAIASGVTFAIAAGNSNANACNYSPASAPNALTVGATTSTDARASFSNYGTCVDLFAPGASIYSSVISGGYESWSGTSMATPHVAGVAALYLAAHPLASPTEVGNAVISGATPDKVTGAGTGSPNLLLYNQIAGGAVTPPPPDVVLHVGDLDGTAAANRNNWSATVSVLVVDAGGAPVSGAAVSGNWSNGASGSASCTTGTNGRCSVSKGGIKKSNASATFSVTGVSLTGASYDASANADPDGDSNGTTIVVLRP